MIARALLAFLAGVFLMSPAYAAEIKKSYFAGGCFWCMESEFHSKPGVVKVVSGFVGDQADKSYEEVSRGDTGYVEAVEVHYDPTKVSYSQLLDIFWRNIDPTDAGGQFYDRGTQYMTKIYVQDEAERVLAEGSKKKAEAQLGKPVATQIEPMKFFHAAEAYHQNYAEKNPQAYARYATGSGRKEKIKKIWEGK